MPPKRTRQSNLRSKNVNFPSASIPSSIVNNTANVINSTAAVVPSTFNSIIPRVFPSATVPAVVQTESTPVPIATTVTLPSIVPAQDDYPAGITPASIVARSLSPRDMPFLNLNHVNLPYAHNNNESIDELINLLAGDQREQTTNFSVNRQLHSPRHTGPNRQRHNRLITAEAAEGLETNLPRRSVFLIIVKYFDNRALALTITNRLFELGIDESLTLTALLSPITSKSRPGKAAQIQLIEDLIESNIFLINRGKSNSVIIRKNPSYQS